MDKHSMSGCTIWYCLKHRHEELRQSTNVIDDAGNETFVKSIHGLPEVIYTRPWGDSCCLFSSDSVQLPPVMMTYFYDDDVGKAGTVDLSYRIS